MNKEKAIIFLSELRESFLDIEKIGEQIKSRKLWNKNINGLKEIIYLLKINKI